MVRPASEAARLEGKRGKAIDNWNGPCHSVQHCQSRQRIKLDFMIVLTSHALSRKYSQEAIRRRRQNGADAAIGFIREIDR